MFIFLFLFSHEHKETSDSRSIIKLTLNTLFPVKKFSCRLLTELCPPLGTPGTIAHQAPLPWDFPGKKFYTQ